MSFKAKVLAVVRKIPRGRVATYGDVALLAGRPRAARAVGNVNAGVRRPVRAVSPRDWRCRRG
jgi:methylated-DNA-protein-cysteine methyltransferase-like protein